MKRIAFVFSTAPHGSASGREGLDALLATSALTEALGVFFLSATASFSYYPDKNQTLYWRVTILLLSSSLICTILINAGSARHRCASVVWRTLILW